MNIERYLGVIYPNVPKTEFYENFKNLFPNDSEATEALKRKVWHMLFNNKGAGMLDVLMMFHSFVVKGPKRLPSNRSSYDHDAQYEWKGEKYSHKGNLPRAHFRYDYGKRYLLTDEELNEISKFTRPFYEIIGIVL